MAKEPFFFFFFLKDEISQLSSAALKTDSRLETVP